MSDTNTAVAEPETITETPEVSPIVVEMLGQKFNLHHIEFDVVGDKDSDKKRVRRFVMKRKGSDSLPKTSAPGKCDQALFDAFIDKTFKVGDLESEPFTHKTEREEGDKGKTAEGPYRDRFASSIVVEAAGSKYRVVVSALRNIASPTTSALVGDREEGTAKYMLTIQANEVLDGTGAGRAPLPSVSTPDALANLFG